MRRTRAHKLRISSLLSREMKRSADSFALRGSLRSSSCQMTSPRPGSLPSFSTRSRAFLVMSLSGTAMYTLKGRDQGPSHHKHAPRKIYECLNTFAPILDKCCKLANPIPLLQTVRSTSCSDRKYSLPRTSYNCNLSRKTWQILQRVERC